MADNKPGMFGKESQVGQEVAPGVVDIEGAGVLSTDPDRLEPAPKIPLHFIPLPSDPPGNCGGCGNRLAWGWHKGITHPPTKAADD